MVVVVVGWEGRVVVVVVVVEEGCPNPPRAYAIPKTTLPMTTTASTVMSTAGRAPWRRLIRRNLLAVFPRRRACLRPPGADQLCHPNVIVMVHCVGMDVTERPAPRTTTTRWSQPVRWWLGRRVWDRRAHLWHHEGSAGLQPVFDAVLAAAAVQPGAEALDLGCGSGQLSVPLARLGAHVTGVDISPRMIEMVRTRAAEEHLEHLSARVSPIERLVLPPASLDLVVSNYAMHHLRDSDKQAVVRSAANWLRPGGRLVVGDMMFGRGMTKRDREIIRSKALTMLRRGPAGWWRLAKNAFRFGLRVREQPVAMHVWVNYFETAGLVDVSSQAVVAEAGIVAGRKA